MSSYLQGTPRLNYNDQQQIVSFLRSQQRPQGHLLGQPSNTKRVSDFSTISDRNIRRSGKHWASYALDAREMDINFYIKRPLKLPHLNMKH